MNLNLSRVALIASMLLVPAVATAGIQAERSWSRPDKNLRPPVTISGSLSKYLLTVNQSGSDPAVQVTATQNEGLVATTSAGNHDAINGYGSNGGSGVIGGSDSGVGVIGISTSGTGGSFSSSGGNSGIYVQTTGKNAAALDAKASNGIGMLAVTGGDAYGTTLLVNNLSSTTLMRLDTSGNLTIKGILTQNGSSKSRGSPTELQALRSRLARDEIEIATLRSALAELAGKISRR